jgi:hypothetical protein
LIKTTKKHKTNLDLAVAKFFLGTNTVFSRADHKTFKRVIDLLRPGYKPSASYDISNCLLDDVYSKTLKDYHDDLPDPNDEDIALTLCQDGWSSCRNDRIISTSSHILGNHTC